MGQYHLIVNLDKHEFLNPWDMGEAAKLLEWGYGSGTMLTALALLLAVSNGRGGGDYHSSEGDGWVGRWGGDRVAVVGDYAEDGDLPAEFHAGDIYRACSHARSGVWMPLEKRIAKLRHSSALGRSDDPYLEKHIEQERRVELMPRFTNISAQMRRVIEADGVVHFKTKTHRTHELDGTFTTSEFVTVEDGQAHLQPDMVISL